MKHEQFIIASPINNGKPWSTTEIANVFELRSRGNSYKAIARMVGRTRGAVVFRLLTKIRVPKTSILNQVPREPNPTLKILRDNLPDYYALGWRVVDFDPLTVQLEWPHQGAPIKPSKTVIVRASVRENVKPSISEHLVGETA